MNYKSIKELKKALNSKKHSVVDYIQYLLSRIEETKEHNAFIEVFDDVLDQAKKADERLNAGEIGELIGVPVAIKDNIVMKGKISTAGSDILDGFISPYDSEVVSLLKSEGAIIIGRTNMDEFGMGGSTQNKKYGTTLNPIDKKHVCGGSSGGSACAVALGLALIALGSDTGGSVRQPASYCGIVGFKPTYGGISRYGLIALSSSLDTIGIFANNTEDVNLVFNLLNNQKISKDTTFKIKKGKKKKFNKVIGIPKQLKQLNIDLTDFDKTIKKFESDGYLIKEVDIPSFLSAINTYYVIQPAEASSNLSRYDGIRYGKVLDSNKLFDGYINTRSNLLANETIRRLVLGTYILSAGHEEEYYKRAERIRDKLTSQFKQVLKDVDILSYPTAPTSAFKIGENKNPVDMYMEDALTIQASLAGLPAISYRLDSKELLPKGIQFITDWDNESMLFKYGSVLEMSR